MEDWTLGLCSALVSQLSLYSSTSKEKSFAIRSVGHLLTLVTNKQAVLDNLSSIFLSTVERRHDEVACASAFGSVASAHLELVLSKCGALYAGQAVKKSTSFFGLIRDRGGEETQARVIAIVLQCVGQVRTWWKLIFSFHLPSPPPIFCFVLKFSYDYYSSGCCSRSSSRARDECGADGEVVPVALLAGESTVLLPCLQVKVQYCCPVCR